MKNLYNKIKENLKAGLHVVVRDLEDNDYCTISNSKDYSGWFDSIEETKQNIRYCHGYSKEYWDNLDLEIVEVFRPEYEPFKVGDKVRILDSIKKTEYWEKFKEYFPDMTGEIEDVYLYIEGTIYLINDYRIGHEYLAPLNEVKEEDNVTLEAIKLLEEKGYKIVIK